MDDKQREDFKKWADANLAWDEQRGQWIGDDIALSAWQARQAEIDAWVSDNSRLLGIINYWKGRCDTQNKEIEALKAKVERLKVALKDLLGDTQHKDHNCGDTEELCPVLRARKILDETK